MASEGPIRTQTLAAAAGGLRIDIGPNGWTTLSLVGPHERPLGAESFYNMVSRLMAALSDPAQPTQDLDGVEATPVLTLWEAHHTIWVERAGDQSTLLVQQDAPGVMIAARLPLTVAERDEWRRSLCDLVAWSVAAEVPLS